MGRLAFDQAHSAVVAELIALRKDRGVTQVELAARLNKTQQFVSLVERGDRRLDLVEFYAIATALGADPVAVFGAIVRVLPTTVEI